MSGRSRPVNAWGGLSAVDRRAQRRAQLLAAGLEVFGTVGYAGTSVRQICRVAGLTERYFYESFGAREGLLLAIRTETFLLARSAVAAAASGGACALVSSIRSPNSAPPSSPSSPHAATASTMTAATAVAFLQLCIEHSSLFIFHHRPRGRSASSASPAR
ncbi:MAG: TetR family transcriptional regulator [Actinophytocola sp.]|nr:TetR family transcriptional regulator [Actinophytocola sp.]